MTTEATLSFRVRTGFVVRLQRVKVVDTGRSVTKTPYETIHGVAFGNPVVALTSEEMRRHAHALEPMDAESAKALEELHLRPRIIEPPAEPPSQAALMAEVTRNVITELLRAGVITSNTAAKSSEDGQAADSSRADV